MEKDFNNETIDRLARIETKIDNIESVRDKAEQAYLMSRANADEIREMKANNKWAWGFIITLAISVIGFLITKI